MSNGPDRLAEKRQYLPTEVQPLANRFAEALVTRRYYDPAGLDLALAIAPLVDEGS